MSAIATVTANASSGQPYAVQAVEQFPKQRSGQLSSQGVRVFSLFVSPATNQVTVPFYNPLQAVGRRVLWDPTGEAYIAGLEICFETLIASDYVPIYPGVTYAFDDGYQFDRLYLRFQSLFTTNILGGPSGGLFIGKLIISNGMYANLAGSTPDIATYIRTTPTILTFGSAMNGVVSLNNWQLNAGGSSYLTYLFSVPGVTAASYTTAFRTTVKNIGSTPIYVSLSGILTAPGGTSFGQLWPLNPGEEKTFYSAARPNNSQNIGTSAPQPIFVYSGDPNASLSWYVESVQ